MELTRRDFLKETATKGAAFATALFMPDLFWNIPINYSPLAELIKLEDKEEPLYVFRDFEADFDEESHVANLDYFNEHQGLLTGIQDRLGGGQLRWRLDNLMHRLLFVPEERQTYATLYEHYCREVIGYLLGKLRSDSPYKSLETLLQEKPKIPRRGVTAFLVHNMAKEYVASYVFSNEEGKSVSVELKGRLFLEAIGSFKTTVSLRQNGTFAFDRDTYTIWQNSAKNVYTALSVPMEETLHIILRDHTERVMQQRLSLTTVETMTDVKQVVREWMAVEEAAAGGLVHTLLPGFLDKHLRKLPPSWIDDDLREKSRFKRYRYLAKGIAAVARMGHRHVVRMYAADPSAFRDLLI
jgi:hypothetical protein